MKNPAVTGNNAQWLFLLLVGVLIFLALVWLRRVLVPAQQQGSHESG
ncbi:MAG TPA: hypothetical protein PKM88_11060 [bacterium]|nr:hypothetical protein [bacterium]